MPLGTINVAPQATPPPPTASSNIIGVTYDFGPNGATFNPPISMTIRYDPANIPAGVSETSLVLAYYDTASGQWVTIQGGAVDPVKQAITVPVSHFTLFTALAPFTAPTLTPSPPTTVLPLPSHTPTPSPVPSITPTLTLLPSTLAIVSSVPQGLAPLSMTPSLTPTTTIVPTLSAVSARPTSTFNWLLLIGIAFAAIVVITVIMLFKRKGK